MEISTREIDSISVVRIEGSLDTNTAPEAQQHLDSLQDAGSQKILIDFEALDYISSAGLRVLLVTAKRLGGSGGSLHICGLNETVDEVFEISGFSVILNVFGTADEAMQGF
ncbi:MAG: STAS domain-containing protein [Gemmatimonadota bacterium]